MRFCTNCGARIPDDAMFCNKCGSPVNRDAVISGPQDAPAGEAPTTVRPSADAAREDAEATRQAIDSLGPIQPTAQMPRPEDVTAKAPSNSTAAQSTIPTGAVGYKPVSPVPHSVASQSAQSYLDAQQARQRRSNERSGAALSIAAGVAVGLIIVAIIVLLGVFVFHVFSFGGDSSTQQETQTSTTETSTTETTDTTDTTDSSQSTTDSTSSTSDTATTTTTEQTESDDSATSGDYVLADSDTRLYTADELSSYSNWELYIARNEIYARHGRGFNNQDLQDYFNSKSWYKQTSTPEDFDESVLSSIERQNADTIKSVEEERGSEYLS